MRVVVGRGLVVAGVLGLALSAAAHAQQFRSWGSGPDPLFDSPPAGAAEGDILLTRCVAVLDQDAPPKKTPGTPGTVIVIPDASPKKGEKIVGPSKSVEKIVRPKPVPAEPVVVEEYDDEGGCADCAGCGGQRACCCRPRDLFYVALSGGWAHRETVHEVDDSRTFIVFNEGFAANVALGWRFCDMFRAEAEYTFMNNDVETAGAAGLSSEAAGNVSLRAWMFNLYHDVQICGCWKPYVGVGIGVVQSEINSLYPTFFDVAGAPMAGVGVNTTSDMVFAYQFRAGISYAISCRAEIYTGYRFFDGDELTFSSLPFSNFAPTFHPDGAEMHCAEMGVRIGF